MDTLKLPFQIGEEYENWEFELDILPDIIKGYDSYKYIGKEFKFFLDYLPDETELIFNLDMLECVLLIFKDRTEQFYEQLNSALSDIIFENRTEVLCNCIIKKYSYLSEEVWTCFYNKSVYLIYGNQQVLLPILNTLIC